MDVETKECFTAHAKNISTEIQGLEELAEDKNYGAFWGKVREIGTLLKENMFRDDRERLRNKFQSVIDNMKKQQQDAAEEITQTLEVLNSLAEDRRYDDFRKKARDISLMFNSLPLERQDRHELQEKRRKIVDDAREQQKAEEQVAMERISNAIDELDKLVRNESYQEFKDRAKEIPSLFKANKTSREDNENLWQRYQNIWQHVKNAEQRQINESEKMKSAFYRLINKAITDISLATTINDIQEVENILEETRELTRAMLPHHRHDCLPLWHETKNKSRYKRKEIYETNFFHLKDEIDIMAQVYLGMRSGADIFLCVMTGGASELANSDMQPHEALRAC